VQLAFFHLAEYLVQTRLGPAELVEVGFRCPEIVWNVPNGTLPRAGTSFRVCHVRMCRSCAEYLRIRIRKINRTSAELFKKTPLEDFGMKRE
jgi:hypothetical protein